MHAHRRERQGPLARFESQVRAQTEPGRDGATRAQREALSGGTGVRRALEDMEDNNAPAQGALAQTGVFVPG
jgi:hypothetical protein